MWPDINTLQFRRINFDNTVDVRVHYEFKAWPHNTEQSIVISVQHLASSFNRYCLKFVQNVNAKEYGNCIVTVTHVTLNIFLGIVKLSTAGEFQFQFTPLKELTWYRCKVLPKIIKNKSLANFSCNMKKSQINKYSRQALSSTQYCSDLNSDSWFSLKI